MEVIKKVVSNARPLIALGKLGQMGLLIKLYGKVTVSPEVYDEVVRGIKSGAPDAVAGSGSSLLTGYL
jgi:predicted nucleic acid-binding protein